MNLRYLQTRRAFTLLELMVVLAIAAVLASVVMLSLQSHFQQAAVARAIDQIILADRLARRTASELTSAQVVLEFDPAHHHLQLVVQGSPQHARSLAWPANVKVAEPQVLGSRAWNSSGGTLEYAVQGSPTYYVHLSSGKVSTWLAVLGLSGQATECASADALQELLP